MDGGAGDDIYYVDSSEDIVAEFAGQGTDTVYATAAFAPGSQNVENLIADSDAGLVLRRQRPRQQQHRRTAAATTGWSAALTAATTPRAPHACTAETAGMC